MTAPILVDPYLGEYATAKVLGCARQTARGYAARGLLTPHRFGGRTFFERSQVEALAKQLRGERVRKPRRRSPR
jgi:hypothetical protein